jgi:hypothetical protein
VLTRVSVRLALVPILLFIGAVLGGSIENARSVPAPTEPVTITRTITRVETVQVSILPASCARALVLASTLRAAANEYDRVTDQEALLLSDVAKYIADHDISQINAAANRHRALQDATLAAAITLNTELSRYQPVADQCKKETS